jgi:outer membrane protein OmpA-like peptidoglycan-associated protein
MKNLIILVIALMGFGINAFAEDKSNKEVRGDKHFFVYSFVKAIDYYSHTKNLTIEGHRRLAESYRNMEQNHEAEKAYSILIDKNSNVLPEDHYQYAMLLKKNGKYAASNNAMDKFVQLMPNDLRGKDYTANKAEYENFSKDDGKYKITTLDINTDREDFAPTFYKDKVVFASSRSKARMIVRNNNWTGNPFYNLYVAEIDGTQLKEPKIFDKGLNGKMHDGPASFSKDGNFMAFTKNNYDVKRKDKVVELEIHFSNFVDGKWSKPEAFHLNNTGYSVGHPTLSADGNTMYFTSDMPGGFGGADIYRVTKAGNGPWGAVENMGDKVNTEGDEMFPFIEENSNTLFFSSNGRFGLGGLDVFICEMQGTQVGRVYNAGAPLNTQFDDYAVIVDEKMSKGYFSSNRTGGSESDNIYSLEILKKIDVQKQISGIAKDMDNNLMASTLITLLDDKNNVLDTITTQNDGAFSFVVDADKNFKLNGKKEKYNDGNNTASTFGEDAIVTADVILSKQAVKEPTKPKKGDDLAKVLNFNPKTIYFDYGKYDIRADAISDLDKIVKVMNENPKMVIELASHTDCISSKGFNQTLSNNRAKASASYIKTRISNPSRISGKGYGETKLVNGCPCEGEVVSECSEDQHQANRRTEFIVIKE